MRRKGRPQPTLEPSGIDTIRVWPPTIGYMEVGGKERDSQIPDFSDWSSSATFLPPSYPAFSTRAGTLLLPGPEIREQKARFRRASLEFTVGDWSRPAILPSTPSDPQVLRNARLWPPEPLWTGKKRRAAFEAGEKTFFSPFPGTIPSSQYTVPVSELLTEIQYHVLCTPDAGVSWDLWSLPEVLAFLNEAIRRFYLETGAFLAHTSWNPGEVVGEAFSLPEGVMEIRRLSFVDGGNTSGTKTYYLLQPVDSITADLFYPSWETTYVGRPGDVPDLGDLPRQYVEDPEEAGKFKTVPMLGQSPINDGLFDLLYIPVPPEVTSEDMVPVPDVFSPYVKWGAMAAMFSKQGEANDPLKASYCEKRFQEGVVMARLLLGLSNGNS